jgi:protein translocase SecG subunit
VIIVNILEIISAAILIILVLLQMQGSGLSSSFGGTGEFYRSKRSVEKLLMYATVVDAIVFAVFSIILLIPGK